MDRTLLLTVLVAALLVAGCTSGDAAPDTPDDGTNGDGITVPADADAVVNYTSSGFEPATVTVQQGDTVAWIDRNPNAPMWVGSDVHPTHTEYDGTSMNEHCDGSGDAFDQCGEGTVYTFTFDRTGEWGYHNHRRATDTGTVVVE